MISCDNNSKRLTCHDLCRLYPKRVGVNLADGVDGMSGSVEALEPEIRFVGAAHRRRLSYDVPEYHRVRGPVSIVELRSISAIASEAWKVCTNQNVDWGKSLSIKIYGDRSAKTHGERVYRCAMS